VGASAALSPECVILCRVTGSPPAAWSSAGSAAGCDLEEALARLRDLVEVELSHRSGSWPLRAIVVLLEVPAPAEQP
jgi:hypothetical protein